MMLVVMLMCTGASHLTKKLEEKSQMDARKQNEKVAKLESQLQNILPQQEGITFDPALRWPPFDLSCPARFYQQRRFWASEPFLVCNGRFKVLLRLCVSFGDGGKLSIERVKNDSLVLNQYSSVKVVILLVSQSGSSYPCHRSYECNVGASPSGSVYVSDINIKNDCLIFCVKEVK